MSIGLFLEDPEGLDASETAFAFGVLALDLLMNFFILIGRGAQKILKHKLLDKVRCLYMGIVVIDGFYFILQVFALFYFPGSSQVDAEVLLKFVAWIFFDFV